MRSIAVVLFCSVVVAQDASKPMRVGELVELTLPRGAAAFATPALRALRLLDTYQGALHTPLIIDEAAWVQVAARSVDFDAHVAVLDGDGRVVAEDCDWSPTSSGPIAWLEPGRYDIAVASITGATGEFELTAAQGHVNWQGDPDITQIEAAVDAGGASVPERVWEHCVIARAADGKGDVEGARRSYVAALAAADGAYPPEHPYRARIMAWRANAEMYGAHYDVQRSLLESALRIRSRAFGPEHALVGDTLRDLAVCTMRAGDLEEAEAFARRAVSVLEAARGRDHPGVASAVAYLGNILGRQARFSDAEPLYHRALAASERALGTEDQQTTRIMNNFADILVRMGRVEESAELLRRVVEIRLRTLGETDSSTADALNNLAETLKRQGNYAAAAPLYERTLAIDRVTVGEDHPYYAIGLNNLGRMLEYQFRYEEAEPLLVRAVAILEKAEGFSVARVLACRGNLANLYLKTDRLAEAEPLLESVLAGQLEASGPDHYLTAEAYGNLAELHVRQGRYEDAIAEYSRALAIERRVHGEDHPGRGRLLAQRGECHLLHDDTHAARIDLDAALVILEQTNLLPDERIRARWRRARVAIAEGASAAALADLERAVEEIEALRPLASGAERARGRLLGGYDDVFETGVVCAVERGDVARAFAFVERARARSFVDQLTLARIDLRTTLPEDRRELVTRERELRSAIAELDARIRYESSRDAGATEELVEGLRADRDAAHAEFERTWVEIKSSSPLFRASGSADAGLDLDGVRDGVVGDDAVLLEYYVGHGRAFVLGVPGGRDAEPWIEELSISADAASALGCEPGPASAEALRTAVNACLLASGVARTELRGVGRPRRRPERSPRDSRTPEAAALADVLLPPAARAAWAGRRRILVSPDGALRSLPFELLRIDERDLLEAAPPIVYLPSATVANVLLQRGRARAPMDRFAVLTVGDPDFVGDPDRGSRLAAEASRSDLETAPRRLPGTGRESDAIRDLFGVDATLQLKRERATERAVRDAVTGRTLVHLATHGLAYRDHGNLFGALLLARPTDGTPDPDDDGRLTLAEIYELDLSACELGVLSACETRVGPRETGESAHSLVRGFLVAGADRVVASQWQVSDESAATLIVEFLRAVADSRRGDAPVDHAAALARAKMIIRRDPRWRSPFHWAPFVLVGRP